MSNVTPISSTEHIDSSTGKITIFTSPVYYKKEDGTYAPIDTRIKSITDAAYQHGVLENGVKYKFKSDPTQTSFVEISHIETGKGLIHYTLTGLYIYDTSTGNRYLIETPKLVTPVVSENQITYPEVFTGVELTFTSEHHRLKENMIFQSTIINVIPDPVATGFNPDTSKFVIGMKIESDGDIIDRTDELIGFRQQDGQEYLFIEPVVAKSANGYILTQHLFQNIDTVTGDYYYGVTYNTSQMATYPLEIDPTVTLSPGTGHTGSARYYEDTTQDANGTHFTTGYTSFSDSFPPVGYTHSWGSDRFHSWDTHNWYRGLTRFDLLPYKGHTIYEPSGSPAVFQWSVNTNGSTRTIDWYVTDDYGLFDHQQSEYTGINPVFLQNTDSTNGAIKSTPSIKSHIIKKKAAGQFIAFQIRHTWTEVHFLRMDDTPTLNFHSYSTFTQDVPTVSGNDVTVSWSKTEDGLTVGDKYRVYYKAGTNLLAADIIAGAVFTEVDYTVMTATLSGLAGGDWSIVVVDTQYVDGAAYEGAQSNVQTATIAGGALPTLTPVNGPVARFDSLGNLSIRGDLIVDTALTAPQWMPEGHLKVASLTQNDTTITNLYSQSSGNIKIKGALTQRAALS